MSSYFFNSYVNFRSVGRVTVNYSISTYLILRDISVSSGSVSSKATKANLVQHINGLVLFFQS